MQIEKIVDYAMPCMMAEKALKKTHEAVLAKDLDQAIAHALTSVTECHLLVAALKDMKEKEHAVRKQTAPV